MTDFAKAFPSLFHVTRSSSLAGIQRSGLLPARSFSAEASANEHANREGWAKTVDDTGGIVWLRWQRLQDHILERRLPGSIMPAQWRAFINSMVFLFPSLDAARALTKSPRDEAVEQIILRFETDELLKAGCELKTCRWNNGYPDRSKPARLRTFEDYRPATQWRRGDVCREITVLGAIPSQVPFNVVDLV